MLINILIAVKTNVAVLNNRLIIDHGSICMHKWYPFIDMHTVHGNMNRIEAGVTSY